MLSIVSKNGKVFAVENGEFIGKLANDISGECVENPDSCAPHLFARSFSEIPGYIYHIDLGSNYRQCFVKNWDQLFTNKDLFPPKTKNIFVDRSKNAEWEFKAKTL